MSSKERKRQALAGSAAAALILATLAAALTLVMGTPTRASAVPDFINRFTTRYPAAAGSRIAVCLLCHRSPSGGDNLNVYGEAVDEDLRFQAVEGFDSDGDGFTNLEEIQAFTFPGNPADNPDTVVVTTTVPGGTTTTAAPGSGGALYTAKCQGCHGYGGGNLVPTTLSRTQLAQVIGAGRGSMPGFSSTLSSAQIGSIADALLAWSQTTTTTAGGTTTTAASTSGAGVFAGNCASCHGANGGNLAGRGLSAARVAAVTSSGTAGMPAFGGTLSSTQINAVAAYVASLGGGATTTTAAGGTTTTGATGSGGALYAASCSGCHGANGGNLAGRGLSAAQVAAVTTSGSGGMPAFGGTLSSTQINAIAGYIASLGAGATTTSAAGGTTTTAAAGSGASLYAAQCAGCHGQAGEGGIGGAIRGSTLDAAAIAALVRDGSGGMPAFGGRLSAEDLAALASYTAGLASGSTGTTSPGETTSTVAEPGGTGPGAHGVVEGESTGAAWWVITLAAGLALAVGSGVGLLLWRSGRHIFRT